MKRLYLLPWVIALCLSLCLPVFAMEPEPVELNTLDVDFPTFVAPREVMPLVLSSSISLYADLYTDFTTVNSAQLSPKNFGLIGSHTNARILRKTSVKSGTNSARKAYAVGFVGYSVPMNVSSGSSVEITWDGFGVFYDGGSNTSDSYISAPGVVYDITGFNYFAGSWYIYDSNFNVLAGPFSDKGSVVISLKSSVSSLVFGGYYSFSYTVTGISSYGQSNITVPISTPSLSYKVSVPVSEVDLLKDTNKLIQQSNSSLAHIDSDMHQVITILGSLSDSASQLSPMEQFESNYLDKMEGQLDQIGEMLSPENTVLPNGGDIAGFASVVQDGLGISGSSFSASEFSDALGAFSGSEATGEGGPWEFFTQAVADALSGEAQSAGLSDDDYIYAWLEMMQGRYEQWLSSSP